MQKQNFKGRCFKRKITKSKEVCRTYSEIADVYVKRLEENGGITEVRCNVLLEGLELGAYTTDFVCTRANGNLMVRECVARKFLTKPLTAKLLEASRKYWLSHGVTDWGLVIDEE